jgi:hypothetical protein
VITFDVTAFFQWLRLRGWRIGVDQYVLAHAVATRAEWTELDELRDLLGPLVCRTSEEQSAFGPVFHEWCATRAVAAVEPPVVPVVERVAEPSRSYVRFIAIAPFLPLALFIGLYFFVDPDKVVQTGVDIIAANRPTLDALSFDWLSIAANLAGIVVAAVALLYWIRRKRRRILRQALVRDDLEEQLLRVGTIQLPPAYLRRTAQQLRVRRAAEGQELAIDRTIDATASSGGWLTLEYRATTTQPEYVLLIERAGRHDHVVDFTSAVARWLAREGVIVSAYTFQGDPRTLWKTGTRELMPLAEVIRLHRGDRLIVVSDGAAFVSRLTGRLNRWSEELAAWEERVILTPQPVTAWGARERILAGDGGFLVAPLGVDSLRRVVEKLNQQRATSDAMPQGVGRLPEILRANPWQWVDREPPPRAQVDRLIAELRESLPPRTFTWLAACAVYPALHTEITLYLAHALGISGSLDGQVYALARLPWFRRGFMPEWLRVRLIEEMSAEDETAAREALQRLFLTALSKTAPGAFSLPIVTRPSLFGRLAWLNFLRDLVSVRSDRGPLHDRVLLDFLRGTRRRPLGVTLPQAIAALLDRARGRRKERAPNPIGTTGQIWLAYSGVGSLFVLVRTKVGEELHWHAANGFFHGVSAIGAMAVGAAAVGTTETRIPIWLTGTLAGAFLASLLGQLHSALRGLRRPLNIMRLPADTLASIDLGNLKIAPLPRTPSPAVGGSLDSSVRRRLINVALLLGLTEGFCGVAVVLDSPSVLPAQWVYPAFLGFVAIAGVGLRDVIRPIHWYWVATLATVAAFGFDAAGDPRAMGALAIVNQLRWMAGAATIGDAFPHRLIAPALAWCAIARIAAISLSLALPADAPRAGLAIVLTAVAAVRVGVFVRGAPFDPQHQSRGFAPWAVWIATVVSIGSFSAVTAEPFTQWTQLAVAIVIGSAWMLISRSSAAQSWMLYLIVLGQMVLASAGVLTPGVTSALEAVLIAPLLLALGLMIAGSSLRLVVVVFAAALLYVADAVVNRLDLSEMLGWGVASILLPLLLFRGLLEWLPAPFGSPIRERTPKHEAPT